ncbi:MAG: small ribosomal subunit Rsm22 family protein [Chloroherpetonaceae bacterium]|nr:small ribosomal subunit Rsm22 family protein [Chloroherpetonaceae bacterium]
MQQPNSDAPTPDSLDFAKLHELRNAFLLQRAGKNDYWTSEKLLSDYHRTFGQRIKWKWNAVLRRLRALHWQPKTSHFLDWGCGSGAASEAMAESFNSSLFFQQSPEQKPSFSFFDRSSLSSSFSKKNFKEKFPHFIIQDELPKSGYTLLLSHLLSELSANEESSLISQIQNAEQVIWVESGDKETSRRLSSVRNILRDKMTIIAPCTHHAFCGALAEGNERHWCHQFAEVPSEAFTTAFWRKFSEAFEIDLRSLPFSFLVLEKFRDSHSLVEMGNMPKDTTRQTILGMPRVYKPHVSLFTCSESGLHEANIPKRHYPEDYKRLKKGTLATHLEEHASGEITIQYE